MNDKLFELQQSKQALQANIEVTRGELAKLEGEGGITNIGRYNELQNQLSNYQNKLAAVEQGIQNIEDQAKGI